MILREIKNIYVPKIQQIEYLESTGTQYIDTGVVSQNNLVYDFELIETQENNQKTFFGFKESDTSDAWWSVPGMNDVNWGSRDNDGYWLYVDFANTETRLNLRYPNRNGKYHFDFTDGNAVFTNNDVVMWSSNNVGSYTGSRHVFIFWMDSQFQYPTTDVYDRKGIGRIYYFQIRKNGELLFDGIPVRVGSVGYLYDRVSKRLFGNKGTGNFVLGQDVNSKLQQIYQNKLIEGVDYETADWLKGDGSAYINTNIKPSENLRTKTKAAYTSSSDSISRNSAIFGSSLVKSGTVSNRYWVNYDGKFEIGYGGYYSTQYSINPNQDIEIDFNYIEDNAHKFKINNSVYTQSGEPNTTRNIVIFGRNVNGSVYVRNCRVSYFQLINSSNLIMDLVPCQLIRSIPRNLDAQCKERQAGECGMIDLISGKFYGNVANSGTFTVENDNE